MPSFPPPTAVSDRDHAADSWAAYYSHRSPMFYYRPPPPLPPPSYYSLPTSRAATPERRSKTPQPAAQPTAEETETAQQTQRRLGQRGRQRDLLGRREKFRRSKSRDRSLERRWADPCGPCPCCERGGDSGEEDWALPSYYPPHGCHAGRCGHRYSYAGPLDYYSGPPVYPPPPAPAAEYRRWLSPNQVLPMHPVPPPVAAHCVAEFWQLSVLW